ncbi:MAG: hypothetical protein H6670_14425 [Anaerolineaceae bacterium]|nr:hypothetical protein [Anaerolineaceae bacterium]
MHRHRISKWMRWLWISSLIGLLAACNLSPFTAEEAAVGTPVHMVLPSVTPQNIPPIPLPPELTDERHIMSGICYEAAYAMRDHVYVIRDAIGHIEFYGDADALGACRWPVERNPYDFETGRALAGIWSYGTGCTAHHDIIDSVRDDANRTYSLRLRFVTEGDCDYELLRPFWVGLPEDMQGYDIQIVVDQ